jgi:hypothetical protein
MIIKSNKMKKLTEFIADKVYDILVEEAGASEYWRKNFVFTESNNYCLEYRFQGNLDFGGKFWNDYLLIDGKMIYHWYVSCYKEDETKERLEIIKKTNKKLKELSSLY